MSYIHLVQTTPCKVDPGAGLQAIEGGAKEGHRPLTMEELPAGEPVIPFQPHPLLRQPRTVLDFAVMVVSQGSVTALTKATPQVRQPVEPEKYKSTETDKRTWSKLIRK